MPALYHSGPVEYVGSKFRRSIPKNLTSVRSRNKAKDMGVMRAKTSVFFGRQKTKVKTVEWLDPDIYKACKSKASAIQLAKLFLETTILKYNGKYWVKMV